MAAGNQNKDLRALKTEKALRSAMTILLNKKNFNKITITDLCAEAMICRATFYAHYIDKYDLLKHSLKHLDWEDIGKRNTYEQAEELINKFVQKNETVIRNLLYDADTETLDILFEFILSTINFVVEKGRNEKMNPKYTVLSNFYAGGMLHYFSWQVKNQFPPEVTTMNKYLYKLMGKLRDLDKE